MNFKDLKRTFATDERFQAAELQTSLLHFLKLHLFIVNRLKTGAQCVRLHESIDRILPVHEL